MNMNGIEELGEILFECYKQNDKVLEWYKKHEKDAIFTTDEGSKLRQHLGGMLKEEALATLQLGVINLMYFLEHPDIPISKELHNHLKNCTRSPNKGSYFSQFLQAYN